MIRLAGFYISFICGLIFILLGGEGIHFGLELQTCFAISAVLGFVWFMVVFGSES